MTVEERLARLEQIVMGNGSGGLPAIIKENTGELKEFKEAFQHFLLQGREDTCYFLKWKGRRPTKVNLTTAIVVGSLMVLLNVATLVLSIAGVI